MGAEDFAALADRVPGLYIKMGEKAMSTLVWDFLARTR
jgi:hypothetical protein